MNFDHDHDNDHLPDVGNMIEGNDGFMDEMNESVTVQVVHDPDELKPPMQWLMELRETVYFMALSRFKLFPLSVTPTERKHALREAFFWGHIGTDEHAFWSNQNRLWTRTTE